MKWPKISVIIPSYNQGKFIERTIRSIQLQNYAGEREIIVSDGGSSDNTVEVLKSLQDIRWWSEKDRGFADAVNRGLKVITGEIVAIQSSDDYYLQNAFHDAVLELHRYPQCVMVSGGEIKINEESKIVHVGAPQRGVLSSPRGMLLWEAYPRQHCTFMRSETLSRLGGLDESVDWCADFDLFYRMLHLGPAVFTPTLYGVYQLHNEQRTQKDPDRWVAAHMSSVRAAEAHPPSGSDFWPDPAEVEQFEVRHTLLWHETIGGESGEQYATQYALRVAAKGSDYAVLARNAARKWLSERHIIPGVPSALCQIIFFIVKVKHKVKHDTLKWWKRLIPNKAMVGEIGRDSQDLAPEILFWCVKPELNQ